MSYIQLYNLDKDPLFVELSTGQITWTLPSKQYLDKVQFVSHISENEQCYFETVETREVTWDLPTAYMSSIAFTAAQLVPTLDRKGCESKIKIKYSEEKTMAQMNELDMFLEDIDQEHKVEGGEEDTLATPIDTTSTTKDPMFSIRSSQYYTSKTLDAVRKTVLKSGYLMKLATVSGRNWKKRFFVLSPYNFSYYPDEKVSAANLKGEFPISKEAIVQEEKVDKKYGYGFKYILPADVVAGNKELSETIVLAAPTEIDRAHWMQQITNLIALAQYTYLYAKVMVMPGSSAPFTTPASNRSSGGFFGSAKPISTTAATRYAILTDDLLSIHPDSMHTTTIEGVMNINKETNLTISLAEDMITLIDSDSKATKLILQFSEEESAVPVTSNSTFMLWKQRLEYLIHGIVPANSNATATSSSSATSSATASIMPRRSSNTSRPPVGEPSTAKITTTILPEETEATSPHTPNSNSNTKSMNALQRAALRRTSKNSDTSPAVTPTATNKPPAEKEKEKEKVNAKMNVSNLSVFGLNLSDDEEDEDDNDEDDERSSTTATPFQNTKPVSIVAAPVVAEEEEEEDDEHDVDERKSSSAITTPAVSNNAATNNNNSKKPNKSLLKLKAKARLSNSNTTTITSTTTNTTANNPINMNSNVNTNPINAMKKLIPPTTTTNTNTTNTANSSPNPPPPPSSTTSTTNTTTNNVIARPPPPATNNAMKSNVPFNNNNNKTNSSSSVNPFFQSLDDTDSNSDHNDSDHDHDSDNSDSEVAPPHQTNSNVVLHPPAAPAYPPPPPPPTRRNSMLSRSTTSTASMTAAAATATATATAMASSSLQQPLPATTLLPTTSSLTIPHLSTATNTPLQVSSLLSNTLLNSPPAIVPVYPPHNSNNSNNSNSSTSPSPQANLWEYLQSPVLSTTPFPPPHDLTTPLATSSYQEELAHLIGQCEEKLQTLVNTQYTSLPATFSFPATATNNNNSNGNTNGNAAGKAWLPSYSPSIQSTTMIQQLQCLLTTMHQTNHHHTNNNAVVNQAYDALQQEKALLLQVVQKFAEYEQTVAESLSHYTITCMSQISSELTSLDMYFQSKTITLQTYYEQCQEEMKQRMMFLSQTNTFLVSQQEQMMQQYHLQLSSLSHLSKELSTSYTTLLQDRKKLLKQRYTLDQVLQDVAYSTSSRSVGNGIQMVHTGNSNGNNGNGINGPFSPPPPVPVPLPFTDHGNHGNGNGNTGMSSGMQEEELYYDPATGGYYPALDHHPYHSPHTGMHTPGIPVSATSRLFGADTGMTDGNGNTGNSRGTNGNGKVSRAGSPQTRSQILRQQFIQQQQQQLHYQQHGGGLPARNPTGNTIPMTRTIPVIIGGNGNGTNGNGNGMRGRSRSPAGNSYRSNGNSTNGNSGNYGNGTNGNGNSGPVTIKISSLARARSQSPALNNTNSSNNTPGAQPRRIFK